MLKILKDYFICIFGLEKLLQKNPKIIRKLKSTSVASTSTNIMEIEGIGEKYGEVFKSQGIPTVEKLLQLCKTKAGREEVAKKTNLPYSLILKWANHADLFRINGVAGQFSELLEASGVDTVVELSKRNPENLLKKMEEVSKSNNYTKKIPSLEQVIDWVEQAKKLPRALEY
jgi:predicted flap endonuclease-1-like 5' DNA nuclease